MKYYSTNHKAPIADLHKAVVKGLAEDRGLYMPEEIHKLPKAFFDDMPKMRFQDIAYNVAEAFFGEDVDPDGLQSLVCDTLQFDYVPLHLDDVSIVLTNSHSPHKLDAGTYNQRVKECQQAVNIISRHKPIRQLADLTVSDFQEIQSTITDPVILRRARHVVTEIQRTRDAVKALLNNDLATFGQLMNQSHQSLRDDYEVTGQELDTLAQTAWQIPGVIGSRMTGGGFGGCTVSLVRNDAIGHFQQTVGDTYRQTTGLQAEFYIAHTGDGARTLQQ
jgi:galactokinase